MSDEPAYYYTDRQVAILEFLQLYKRMRGLSPTLEEIAQNFGVSKVTVYDHVKQLEKKGAISREKHQSRSIQILDPEYAEVSAAEVGGRNTNQDIVDSSAEQQAQDFAGEDTSVDSNESEFEVSSSNPKVTGAANSTKNNPFYCPVSVLGKIAAGEPIEALEQEEVVDLADLLPMGRQHYALRVQGDSMIDEGIHEGDLVIVERRSVAEDGEVVVAILPDNYATLKKLYRVNSASNLPKGLTSYGEERPKYRLQPANERLEPIFTNKLEIRGVVVGVVRKLR